MNKKKVSDWIWCAFSLAKNSFFLKFTDFYFLSLGCLFVGCYYYCIVCVNGVKDRASVWFSFFFFALRIIQMGYTILHTKKGNECRSKRMLYFSVYSRLTFAFDDSRINHPYKCRFTHCCTLVLCTLYTWIFFILGRHIVFSLYACGYGWHFVSIIVG